MNTALIYPMFAMVMLSALVLVIMFSSRVYAVRSKKLKLNYFKSFQGGEPPEFAIKAGRHFTNLFEAPILFYAGCIVAMVLPINNPQVVNIAWGYVIARALHTLIHLTVNRVYPRLTIYFISWIFLVSLWIQIISQL